MSLNFLDLIFNILALSFWVTLWNGELLINSKSKYLSKLAKISVGIFNFMHPAFPMISCRVFSLFALVFIILFRSVLFYYLSGFGNSDLILVFGIARSGDFNNIISAMAFSIVSFAILLIRISVLAFIYGKFGLLADTTTEFLAKIMNPFRKISFYQRILILLFVSFIVVVIMDSFGKFYPGIDPYNPEQLKGSSVVVPALNQHLWMLSSFSSNIVQIVLLSLYGLLNTIPFITSTLIMLFVFQLFAWFLGSAGLIMSIQSWISLIVSPIFPLIKKWPNMKNFTPLLFLLLCFIVYMMGVQILIPLIWMLK